MKHWAALVAACHVGAWLLSGCGTDGPAASSRDAGGASGADSAAGSGGEASSTGGTGGARSPGDGGVHDGAGGAGTPRDSGTRDGAADPDAPDVTTTVDASLPRACTDADAGLPDRVHCILHIDGRAVDAMGAPIATHTLVSACGPAQCAPGYTSSSGAFSIPVGLHLDPDVYSAQLHVRPDRAAFYYALPKGAPGPVIDLGELRVLDLPAHGPLLSVVRTGAPAQAVTSGDVTLEVADGVYVRLDVESNLAGDHGREFRALAIPGNFVPDFADASLGVVAMYAFEPFESSFEVPGAPARPVTVRLSFDNAGRFAAGAAVDVLALGTYVYPDWVTPAAFEKVATAHVTGDGAKVVLDAGEGLLHLTWVALRAAP